MPDLNFLVEGVETERFAAAPLLIFKLRVTEAVGPGAEPTPIHAVALRCQVRIEPAKRRYSDPEKQRLVDLFGTPDRWGQTLRPMLWTHVSAVAKPFTGTSLVDLPVPCTADFSLAASKYFDALDDGDALFCFLFSGTIFYETGDSAWQIEQISWEKEANFRLSAGTWRGMMDLYYPNTAWLTLRKDVFDRLSHYRSRLNLPSWERAMEHLLASAEEPVSS